jgi:hypothetical protein
LIRITPDLHVLFWYIFHLDVRPICVFLFKSGNPFYLSLWLDYKFRKFEKCSCRESNKMKYILPVFS